MWLILKYVLSEKAISHVYVIIFKEKMISYYKYLKTLNCMKMHNGVQIVNKIIRSLKAIKLGFNVLK